MNFIVTYRDSAGNRKEMQLQSHDRTDLFEQLRKLGITAVSIREGKIQTKISISRSYGTYLAIVALGLAALIGYLLLRSPEQPKKNEEPARQQKFKTKPVMPAKPAAQVRSEKKQIEKRAVPSKVETAKRSEAFKDMTQEDKLAYLRERMMALPLPAEPPSNRLYRTGVEQVMDWIFTCEVGAPPPILPNISQYERLHLAEILISDNPVLAGDSERTIEAKEMMARAKKEFRDFIKEGGSPDEFLSFYHGQLVASHEEWKEARKAIFDTVRQDPAIALEFAKEINEKLSAKGIKQVVIPEKMMEKFGIKPEE